MVGSDLPKTDFLTKIDQVIVQTTASIALTGVLSLVLHKIHLHLGKETAERWNLIAEVVLVGLFVLFNLVIFVPPWLAQARAIKHLSSDKKTLRRDRRAVGGYEILHSQDSEEAALNVVGGRFEYFTLAQIRAMTQT